MKQNDFMSEDLKTMVSCLNVLAKKGYTEDYKVTEQGMQALKSKKIYLPRDIKDVNFYRFEGNSDPSDNSILYAIETKDGSRGTLADAFGPYADTRVSEFMKQVESEVMNKKV